MKRKFTARPSATAAIVLLAALSASALFWHVIPARADDDTPAQAAAREALLKKMQQTDATNGESALAPVAPVVAYGGTNPPAPVMPAPAPMVAPPPAAATLQPQPPAPFRQLTVNTPPTSGTVPPVSATPTASAATISAFGGSTSPKLVGQPISITADTDGWAGVVSPPPPTTRMASMNPGLSILVPTTVDHDAALEQHTHGKVIEDFHADHLDLRVALALFASQNNLNIVPDNNITGTVTLDVHNLPLDQMMSALLDAGDCAWEEDNGLIRVRNTETRTFVVDYLRLQRTGTGTSSATLTSATTSSSGGSTSNGGGSGGGSGGGGGGGGSGGGSGGSGGGSGSGGSVDSSSMSLTENNPTDFWTELRSELVALLTPEGVKTLAINKTAGIIQVTDRPSALKRVQAYLMATEQSVNRQVDIETKIYDVTLNNEFQFGIDWDHVASAYAGTLGFGTATLPLAVGSASSGLGNSAINGLNQAGGLNNIESGVAQTPTTLAFQNMNSQVALTALQTQGTVTVIAAPRIRTLNNQTAVIKVGVELPFFAQSSTTYPSGTETLVTENTVITTVTVGTIMSITPQISDDGWISMDISPVLTALVANDISPDGSSTAPELTDKQASTLARVRNGTTVVLGGLIQTEDDQSANQVPVLGDIPVLGKLFTGKYHAKTKNELVIFVTPHIVEPGEPSVKYLDVPKDNKKSDRSY